MFRQSSAIICPFCEASAAYRTRPPKWQSTRSAATLQKRRPSRMNLSPNVARGPPQTEVSGKPIRKSRNSPFGGMNQTEPPRPGYLIKNPISASEQKRAGRFAKDRPDKDGKEPMKALKMQRALASVSYEARGRVKQTLQDLDSFEQFDLLPVLKESVSTQALGGMMDVSPTPVQRLAIPALLGTEDGKRRKRKEGFAEGEKKEMQQFLLAAETGSGKTLAYVLPILDALKRAEKVEAETERTLAAQQPSKPHTTNNRLFDLEVDPPTVPGLNAGRPRAIILLPTSELVAQVGALLKSLSHTVKFKSAMLSTAFTSTVIRSRLFHPGGVDVVVSTPHLLSSITESDPNVLSRVTHLVIDEADSLLDRSFSPITSSIIDRATPSLQQLILCSATIPRSLDTYLQKRFPAVKRLVTPNLHAIPRRVQLSVVDIDKMPFQGNRDLACAQTIYDIGKEGPDEVVAGEGEREGGKEKKIVVFVNEREKASELTGFLRGKGIDAMALSRDSEERGQMEVLAEFTGASIGATARRLQQGRLEAASSLQQVKPAPMTGLQRLLAPSTPAPTPTSSSRSLPGVKVLVTTDLGSRGIDTILVRHVVLYDVPHTSIDFIHRLGRVGRMGRRGRGVVLVGKGDRKDVVAEVRGGMFKGVALI
ncbi:RNA helicase [Friedmanniomyces endolithicus]|uniref:RNA helicase n=1 Tax=Friedmanniomyces endolithicus TaxID=329885 RepID=A0AAN6FW91_9PEZI|nr:RNA helicase [Friedmanniomyces endolithicus]KAK0294249.1 RNA helicase [Friedmanniomyces endolithicus]KAK0325470.1 RNA helicase [Friedmanniomyces endolithicus]KAK1003288.1 RNA helicase [Friedmanniomyces endolithicus]